MKSALTLTLGITMDQHPAPGIASLQAAASAERENGTKTDTSAPLALTGDGGDDDTLSWPPGLAAEQPARSSRNTGGSRQLFEEYCDEIFKLERVFYADHTRGRKQPNSREHLKSYQPVLTWRYGVNT